MIDTVIINAKVVTPSDITHGCIAIDGGRIEMVGSRFLMPKSREVIDAFIRSPGRLRAIFPLARAARQPTLD